jgi:hypothetical protein
MDTAEAERVLDALDDPNSARTMLVVSRAARSRR